MESPKHVDKFPPKSWAVFDSSLDVPRAVTACWVVMILGFSGQDGAANYLLSR